VTARSSVSSRCVASIARAREELPREAFGDCVHTNMRTDRLASLTLEAPCCTVAHQNARLSRARGYGIAGITVRLFLPVEGCDAYRAARRSRRCSLRLAASYACTYARCVVPAFAWPSRAETFFDIPAGGDDRRAVGMPEIVKSRSARLATRVGVAGDGRSRTQGASREDHPKRGE
jgi:hypothetical protein